MTGLETTLYQVSKLFLTPVLLLLSAMFVFALFSAGTLVFDLCLRGLNGRARAPLARFLRRHPGADREALGIELLRLLEPLRLTSRVAPMLGLVATMIPMGPALVALSSADVHGIAQNLVVAFSAVIIALLSASMTYAALVIRRRWLLAELNALANAGRAAHG